MSHFCPTCQEKPPNPKLSPFCSIVCKKFGHALKKSGIARSAEGGLVETPRAAAAVSRNESPPGCKRIEGGIAARRKNMLAMIAQEASFAVMTGTATGSGAKAKQKNVKTISKPTLVSHMSHADMDVAIEQDQKRVKALQIARSLGLHVSPTSSSSRNKTGSFSTHKSNNAALFSGSSNEFENTGPCPLEALEASGPGNATVTDRARSLAEVCPLGRLNYRTIETILRREFSSYRVNRNEEQLIQLVTDISGRRQAVEMAKELRYSLIERDKTVRQLRSEIERLQSALELGINGGGGGNVITSSTVAGAATPAEALAFEIKYAKYAKMQKMNMPEGAIRGKMRMDGLTEEDQDAFFVGPVASVKKSDMTNEGGGGDMPLRSLPKFQKYAKMLQMNMPEGAIRGKMRMDGVSEEEQDLFFSGGSLSQAAAAPAAPPCNTLPEFEKYVKMQKMGLPDGAVRGKMRMAGISDAVADAFFAGLPLPGTSSGSGKAKKKPKPKPREFRTFFWEKISKLPDCENDNEMETIWHVKVKASSPMHKSDPARTRLELSFGTGKAVAAQRKKRREAEKRRKEAREAAAAAAMGDVVRPANIIDAKRIHTVGIAISRLEVSPSELRKSIERMDNETLDPVLLEKMFMQNYMPTDDESKALLNYRNGKGTPANPKLRFDERSLNDVEIFMLEMACVPRLQQRLRCIVARHSFRKRLKQLKSDASALIAAYKELRKSRKFARILKLVLTIGNTLNENSNHGNALGFRLKSLSLLSKTKAVSADAKGRKLTLLHFIANELENMSVGSTDLSDEFTAVLNSLRISSQKVRSDSLLLQSDFRLLESELKVACDIQSNSAKGGWKGAAGAPRAAAAFVEAFAPFADDAKAPLKSTQKLVADAAANFSLLLRWFGEEPGKQTADERAQYIASIADFAARLKQAHDDLVRFAEADAEEENQEIGEKNQVKEKKKNVKHVNRNQGRKKRSSNKNESMCNELEELLMKRNKKKKQKENRGGNDENQNGANQRRSDNHEKRRRKEKPPAPNIPRSRSGKKKVPPPPPPPRRGLSKEATTAQTEKKRSWFGWN
eukprot:g1888.t1